MASDIDGLLERLKRHPSVTVHRGATDEDIRHVYRTLKVKLPRSYLAFLRQCGWADLNGDTLYGLGPDAADSESVLENAVIEHVGAKPPMRCFLVPLMNDGAGNHDCLDTRKIKDGDCPVVLWDHEDPRGELQRPKRVAPSFTVWLRRQLDEMPGEE